MYNSRLHFVTIATTFSVHFLAQPQWFMQSRQNARFVSSGIAIVLTQFPPPMPVCKETERHVKTESKPIKNEILNKNPTSRRVSTSPINILIWPDIVGICNWFSQDCWDVSTILYEDRIMCFVIRTFDLRFGPTLGPELLSFYMNENC